jgi:hypothetical protein
MWNLFKLNFLTFDLSIAVVLDQLTEGWHRSLAKILDLAHFLHKGTLDQDIEWYINDFWIKYFLMTF